jgi:hypothetical protein
MLKKTVLCIAAATVLTFSGNGLSASQPQEQEGVVLQTMDSAGYTYIHVDSGSAKSWIAVPQSKVTQGERIRYTNGMEMKNFHSKSLNRTFPSIIFSSGLISDAKMPAVNESSQPEQTSSNSFAAAVAREQQAPQPTSPSMMGQSSGGSSGAIVPFSEIVVEKASGDNSFTVEEVFAKAKDLNGQTIRLRGKVVKFSPNIMGRNWVHIQDGTGNPMNNTHDLVITTSETVASDQVVLFEGKLATGKDFGAGYKYEAIVEEAQIIK